MVLLQGFSTSAASWFYPMRTAKRARELATNSKAGLAFHWKSLRRQVRLRGRVETVNAAESTPYFASRPRSSQIGRLGEQAVCPLESRTPFEKALAAQARPIRRRAGAATAILDRLPRRATVMEFWHERPFRLQ